MSVQQVKRRDFIAGLGGAAAWPVFARAQQPASMRRIGVLLFAAEDRAAINPLLSGLEALGYIDGKTVAIAYREAAGNSERAPDLANELVRLNPDVIFSFGGDLAPAIKNATATIPIIVVVSNDPVESGLVASLARPGGNVTGITQVHDMLAGKSIELLKAIVPSVSRVAVLWNPDHADPEFRETQRGSRTLDVRLQSLEVRGPDDYDDAFQAAMRERAEALIVIGARLQSVNRHRIGDFAEKNRLILVGVPAWLIEIGALFTYGPNVPELMKRAATYVDKILKGAKPSDLPMQQPTAFELHVNLRAARRLSITVPQTIIARADEVIE
jgi:putative tryptophan/tyrosine transport system substrate-binding protein